MNTIRNALIQAASLAAGLATIPAAHGAEPVTVPITARGESYTVQIGIGGQWRPCILDTGADWVVIPLAWINRPGSNTGYVGTSIEHMRSAEGQVRAHFGGRMTIAVGGVALRDVNVILGDGDCLLGQSFLARFRSVTFDYAGRRLILGGP
jgi:predicted aspartyl protease